MPLAPPVTVKLPATALTDTNWLAPKLVLLNVRLPAFTSALTPVAVFTALTAAAIELTAVPLAKLSCSVPALPPISSVTPVAPVIGPPA